MKTKDITSRNYFKSLKIVYYVSIIELLLFLAIAVLLSFIAPHHTENIRLIKISSFVIPTIVVLGFLCSKTLFKRKLEKLKYENDLKLKMEGYRSALIIKYLSLKVPAFIAILASILTGEMIFLTLSVLLILMLFIEKPSPIKAARDLELNSENTQIIANPNKIIV